MCSVSAPKTHRCQHDFGQWRVPMAPKINIRVDESWRRTHVGAVIAVNSGKDDPASDDLTTKVIREAVLETKEEAKKQEQATT